MRKFTKALAVASVSASLVALLAGCSEEAQAVPDLPERMCWDVFTSEEVSPLLPSGKEAKFIADSHHAFYPDSSSLCSLQIDGAVRFQAGGHRFDFESDIDWTSWEKLEPESIDVGKEGILWYSGAASYIVCEPSKGPNSPGRYIELSLHAYDRPSKGAQATKNRRIFRTLLEQFVVFAQKELKCA
ncbi:hypothetical protein OG379_15345 [Streptomyces sp. NBC_01166]|uniref:hypothetical protein n=1 Tax=Streptomyces sp. NBC_01166 TaxID=2903755 RepID=UPI00386F3F19|nr:hypothetical protein OG379_15345 [Streptomyces sp. NBC_01166]